MTKEEFLEQALNHLYSGDNKPRLSKPEAKAFGEDWCNVLRDGSFKIQWLCFKEKRNYTHLWSPKTGWAVCCGRGTWGEGQSLEEAIASENEAYEAACRLWGR